MLFIDVLSCASPQFSGNLSEEIAVLLGKWDRAAAEGDDPSGGGGGGGGGGAVVNVHYDMSMLTLDMIMRVGKLKRTVV